MVAAIALAAGIVAGLAAGGSVMEISRLRLRGEITLLVAFIVQAVARGRLVGTVASSWGTAVWIGASVLLVGLLAVNARHPGAVLAAGGTLLNVVVVLANGAMPVVLAEGLSVRSAVVASASGGFYRLAQPGMLAVWAGDVLPLNLLGETYFLSIGDVLLGVGVAVLVASTMLQAPVKQPQWQGESADAARRIGDQSESLPVDSEKRLSGEERQGQSHAPPREASR
jgi:hypothetical protein